VSLAERRAKSRGLARFFGQREEQQREGRCFRVFWEPLGTSNNFEGHVAVLLQIVSPILLCKF